MEIEVGEYIRTSKGYLFKTTEYWVEEYNENPEAYEKFKHSKNIIDLIEVGDVITTNNLCGEITKIEKDKIYLACSDCCYDTDIKSIVTKEQFKSVEYRLEK